MNIFERAGKIQRLMYDGFSFERATVVVDCAVEVQEAEQVALVEFNATPSYCEHYKAPEAECSACWEKATHHCNNCGRDICHFHMTTPDVDGRECYGCDSHNLSPIGEASDSVENNTTVC